MATNVTANLPNPFTPLAFLPPTIADELQASIYVTVAALSAFTWDWLMSITEEIKMCRKRKFTLVMAVYFIARIGTLANCAMAVVFLAAPVSNCQAFIGALGASAIIAFPFTSTLFFLQVKAVYFDNNIIKSFFGLLLFAEFALSFLAPSTIKSAHLATTQRCIATHVTNYFSAPGILHSFMTTLVFFAISFRMSSHSISGDTFGARMRSFMRGDGLPHFSRSLLQGGQMYYFATIGLNIVVIVLALAPVPLPYRTMFLQPHIALDNAMASRVFRRVRLGLITNGNNGSGVSSMRLTTLPFINVIRTESSFVGKDPLTVHVLKGSQHSEEDGIQAPAVHPDNSFLSLV